MPMVKTGEHGVIAFFLLTTELFHIVYNNTRVHSSINTLTDFYNMLLSECNEMLKMACLVDFHQYNITIIIILEVHLIFQINH